MYHSITITDKNTYDDFGLMPTSRPLVNPPEVKTAYTDLPSSHGHLDYTEYLLSEVPYGQREGSWEFVCKPGVAWAEAYSSIMNYTHGQKHKIILEDDPGYVYTGRLSVNQWTSDKEMSTVVIDYNLAPFKYPTETTEDMDWLWNDLFEILIKYGTFQVSGQKYRTFINNGARVAVPTFTCSAPMTVTYGGQSFTLVAGKNYNINLGLQPGDNEMVFYGNGTVTVSYSEVSL